jgi:hypothetical protein
MLVRRLQIAVVLVVAVLGLATAAWAGVPVNQRHVRNVYHCELFRDADVPGETYWTNELDTGHSTRPGMARAFTRGDESLGLVVSDWYFVYLGREADPSGLTYWINELRPSTANQIEPRFAASDEAFAEGGGNNSAYIDSIYNAILGRSADTEGKAHWLAFLANGGSRATFVHGVFNSSEAFGVFTDDAYGWFLDRPADTGGRTYYVNLQKAGASVADLDASFLGSAEFYQRAVDMEDVCNPAN